LEKIPFSEFLKTFIETIKSFDFFVDWEKAVENTRKIEKRLNIMNYLIGKEEMEKEFKQLIAEYPEVITVFPILIATRDNEHTLINEKIEFETFSFKERKLNDVEIDNYYKFFKNTGIEMILRDKKIKNLVDYVFGVEVGMDTNARKNRTGTSMENIVENYIEILCSENNDFEYISQATQSKIFEKWNYKIKTDKTARRFDFAIFNKPKNRLFLIEVNFYGSQGSKLKATAGEYQSLENLLRPQNIDLIWITDGLGWESAKNALEETYNHNKYVINLYLLKNGVFKGIINGKL
jgi:type II restriction enzyme